MIKRIGDIVLLHLSDLDSNIYLIGDTAVDAGTGFNFTRMYTFLETLKIPAESIKQVINTHCHFDHVGGDGFFPEASIAIHEIEAPVLEQADPERSITDFFDGKLSPKEVEKWLQEGDELTIGNHIFKVLHTPGHSPGSVCLYDEKAKLLISGDTVFSNGVGRTDLPGGDKTQLIESLTRLSSLAVEKILPGHGDVVMANGSKVIKDMLKVAQTTDEEEYESFT